MSIDQLRIRLLLAATLALLISVPAHAVTVEPGTTFSAMWMLESDLTDTTVIDTADSVADSDGTFSNVGVQGADTTGLWQAQWSWIGNSDPFVTNNFTLTNLSSSTQTFTITSTIGVVPIGPASLTSGSIDGSITDNNTDSVKAKISTVGGNALYSALIDGSVYETLLDDPFSVEVASLADSADVGPANFGLPANSQLGPAITTDIGIRIQFSLTPDDSVSFTSRFEVEAVPVPAAVWLFGSGLLGLVGIARRKKA